MKTSCLGGRTAKWILAVVLFPASLLAEPVSLKRVVELALTHATGAAIAAADEQRAAASYRELSNNYIPQLSTGAGLGYSYGFPLALEGSAPSLFNINTQSALLNPSLRDFVRAAKADSAVASLKTKDERNQIIQDAALSYAELAKWEQRLTRLQETETAANQMQAAVAERVKEGVDSEIDGTKARLSAARVRLRVAEAQGAADVLREHLSKLTGLARREYSDRPGLDSRATCDRHRPGRPERSCRIQSLGASRRRTCARAISAGPRRTQITLASGRLRCSIRVAFEVQQLSELLHSLRNRARRRSANFLCVTNNFQQNNATVGVNIRFPLFNASQRARAQAADADALQGQQTGGSRSEPGLGRNSAPAALGYPDASRARCGSTGI